MVRANDQNSRANPKRSRPSEKMIARRAFRVVPVGACSHTAHGSETPRFGGAQVRRWPLLRLPLDS